MLDAITPVLLTYNEAPNIARTLKQLAWAKDIVVVDSFSTDDTVRIAQNTPRVRLFRRSFDSHHAQWRYAMEETAIATPWVLRLDADYFVPDSLIGEMAALNPDGPEAGYVAGFDYAVYSRKLRSSLYPPKPVLLRMNRFSIRDDGHTEGWDVHGPTRKLSARIIHDDWKPMDSWAAAQIRYMLRERDSLESHNSGFRDWLRMRPPLMPIVAFLYCLFGKGLLLNGRAGLLYALQRTSAETTLALLILERKLSHGMKDR